MQKFQKLTLTKKRKKTLIKVVYNQSEANSLGNNFDVKWVKESNQYLSKDLEDAITRLVPHLMFASELIDESIKLDREMDYESWFKDHHFQDDARFDNVVITDIEFIGTEALDAVKLKGYKATSKTDKEFKVKIETPVINLDRVKENRYALASIIDAQIDDIQLLLTGWLERGETLSQVQQMTMFEDLDQTA